jgi:hypothetical protein
VVVNQLAFADGTSGVPDGVAILDDILALDDVAEGKLVAGRDAGQLLQGNRHGISRVYLKKRLHLS